MANRRVDHVGIMVKDMAVSIPFYTEMLGLTLKDRITHTNGVIELAFLGFGVEGETDIELIQGYPGALANEGRVHHVAINVPDVEAEFQRLKGLNVNFLDQEITTLPNGYRYFFVSGPDNEWIELFQR